MSKQSIRIKSNTVYEIEVNDKGEVIVIDPEDLNLYEHAYEMMDSIKEAETDFNNESKEIEKLEESDSKTRQQIECLSRYFKKGRNAIDIMFGEGSSLKIFGESNFLSMFDQFADQMEPHFEKAGLNAKEMRKKLNAKYANRKTRRHADKVLN